MQFRLLNNFKKNLDIKYFLDVAWQASGNSIAQVIALIGLPILTRIYTPESFGAYAYFLQLVVFFSGFLGYKFEFFIQQVKRDFYALLVIRITLIISITLSILSTIAILLLNKFLEGFSDAASSFLFCPCGWDFGLIFNCKSHYLQRLENFKSSGISEIVLRSSYIFFAISFYYFGLTLSGLILGFLVSYIFKFLYIIFNVLKIKQASDFFIRNTRINFLKTLSIFKNYFLITSSSVTSHFLMMITSFGPIIIFERLYGSTFLGQYFLAYSVLYLPTNLISSAMGKVYYQRASLMNSQNQSFIRLWSSTMISLIIFGIPIFTSAFFLSELIFKFTFGIDWLIAGQIASILSISSFFSFISVPFENTCLVLKKAWYPIFWHSLRALLTLVCCFMIIKNELASFEAIYAFISLNTLMYLIDIYMQRKFILDIL